MHASYLPVFTSNCVSEDNSSIIFNFCKRQNDSDKLRGKCKYCLRLYRRFDILMWMKGYPFQMLGNVQIFDIINFPLIR